MQEWEAEQGVSARACRLAQYASRVSLPAARQPRVREAWKHVCWTWLHVGVVVHAQHLHAE